MSTDPNNAELQKPDAEAAITDGAEQPVVTPAPDTESPAVEAEPAAVSSEEPAAAEPAADETAAAADTEVDATEGAAEAASNETDSAEENTAEEDTAAEDTAAETAEAEAEEAEADDSDVEDTEVDESNDDESDVEAEADEDEAPMHWYILKVQVNREDSIRDALARRVKVAGLERHFADIVVPTEDVAEFTKSGKRKIVKRKLYPGYIMVHMSINDDTWFLVRETPGIGDFTGSAGKPTPMEQSEVDRIIKVAVVDEEGEQQVRAAIPFKTGDRVRVKEGYFENFEGDVESIDEANGRITVMINIFGRSTPVELEHWQVEAV